MSDVDDDADAVHALGRARAAGPYFAIRTDIGAEPEWLPLTALLHDPRVVHERVAAVRATLAGRTGLDLDAIDLRACASIHFLGFASRLLAPALAAACLAATVPVARVEDVRWQRVDGGPVPIAVTDVTGAAVRTPDAAAAALHGAVVAALVTPLVQAFATDSGVTVSSTVLWGNVASAVAGAASMLLRTGETFALDPTAVAVATIEQGVLTGTGGFGVDGRYFRRSNCCLFYRIPGGGTCGDCVLD